ncbi:MAG: DEAD/DEAH box helicase [Acidobacteriota bacterium]|nr:DEAD/DEAH box helicase [Acidobacteriota bacterium]
MENFEEFGLSDQVMANLKEKNYEKPTDVQVGAIPPILEKKDVVIQSRTGSGKTAAFGLPLIESVMADVPAVQFVCLVPTRELAAQVHEELSSLSKDTEMKVCAIYGGTDMNRQIRRLRDGAQVVVGTPGRILDHLKRRTMSFSVVRGIVLDEADKMLSMGFLPDVQNIMRQLPKRRQVVMSSATFPYSIEQLILDYMEDPVKVDVSSDEGTPKEIDHYFCSVQSNEKETALLALLEKEQPEFSLIFCNTKVDVKSVHFFLTKAGIKAEEMSSDMSQSQRERSLKRIRMGVSQHMVCTDLAARGIDIPALSHVFCFSSSADSETYVHRTGRTGRAGKSGKAISLVSTLDLAGFQTALKTTGLEAQEIHIPTEDEITDSRAQHLHTKLEEINYGHAADVRDEYSKVADQLTDEQVRDMLPLLLEHFDRPVVLLEEAPRPAAAPRDNREERRESRDDRRDSRGRRDDRGRGRRDDRRDSRGRRDDRGGRGRRDDRGGGRDRGGRGRDMNRDDRGRDRRDNRGRRDDRGGSRERRRDGDFSSGPRQRSTSFTTLVLSLGRADGLDEMDIQNILRRQGRARMDDIGDIRMKDHESFINVGDNSVENVLSADGKHFKSFELYISRSPEKLEPQS